MPISRIIIISFLLLHAGNILSTANVIGDDDSGELEELLAIDDEEENGGASTGKPSEAEVLSRAQRIVLELGNDNAKLAIDGNELVLLLGYAPWCPRSAELMPRFAKAATALRAMGSPLVFAKLDAERHAKSASLFGIKGFPTILLFVNGTAIPYTGGFTGEEIVIWARKKTGSPIIRLSSTTEAEDLLKKHHIFLLGFFEKYEGIQYEKFVKTAVEDNEVQFVETNDIIVAKALFPDVESKKHFIGLVKSEPERFENFEDEFEEEKILQFVEYNKFPLVTVLTELNSARVYSSPIKVQVFVFAEADDFKHLYLLLQDAARKYKTKIMFVLVDSAEDNLAKPFLSLFGLDSEKMTVTGFDNRIGSKYLLESVLTPSSLEEFSSGLLNGTLSPYFKSESKPNEKFERGMIEKVVGRTFDSSILESIENVLLEVYTPWCIDCEATSKQVEKLARHFKVMDNLKFARIDASLNEHPKLQINNYPTLLFYPASDKSNPMKLSKKSNLKDLVAFVIENMKSDHHRGDTSEEQPKKDEL